MGGFLVLSFGRSEGISVNDVTGMLWASDHELVYTTSPVYGMPGVYVFDCNLSSMRRIVAPRTLNAGYPDGADYFELKEISRDNRLTVYFYYVPDVDRADFKNLRNPDNLFQVSLDGTGFQKVR